MKIKRRIPLDIGEGYATLLNREGVVKVIIANKIKQIILIQEPFTITLSEELLWEIATALTKKTPTEQNLVTKILNWMPSHLRIDAKPNTNSLLAK